MYKLLIVDDESFIADGLYRTFSALPDLSLEVYRTYTAGRLWNFSPNTVWTSLSPTSICPAKTAWT